MIKNDGISPFNGKVVISVTRFSDAKVTLVNTVDVSLASGAGVIRWFCTKQAGKLCDSWNSILNFAGCKTAGDCIVTTSIQDSNGNTIADNFVPLTSPVRMKLPVPTVSFSVDAQGVVTLKSDKFLAFVTLTTRAQGRFSENAFLMYPGTKQVQFNWFGNADVPTLRSSLRVEHAQMYIVPDSNLAEGQPCNASSTDDDSRTCLKAFDGDLGTRWSSNYTDDNWIYVDLGAQKKISKIVLFWEAAYAKGFQIQTSNDQKTWTTQYENDQGSGGISTIPLNLNARWVKLNAYARGTSYGYSLWEIQIY